MGSTPAPGRGVCGIPMLYDRNILCSCSVYAKEKVLRWEDIMTWVSWEQKAFELLVHMIFHDNIPHAQHECACLFSVFCIIKGWITQCLLYFHSLNMSPIVIFKQMLETQIHFAYGKVSNYISSVGSLLDWWSKGSWIRTPPMLSYLDLVQLANKSRECKGWPDWVTPDTCAYGSHEWRWVKCTVLKKFEQCGKIL